MTGYRLTGRTSENRPHGDRWAGAASTLGVTDDAGRIVAWYERNVRYRSVEVRAQFRRPDGTWETHYRVPAGSTARHLRAWFLAEVAARYGIRP